MKNLLFAYLIFLGCAFLYAQPNVPEVKSFANDFTGTLGSAELGELNRRLKTFSDSTSNQLVFVMVSSLEGNAVEEYSYALAKKNKIGSKLNNGILFLIAKNDRKMRIEVGYGLEGPLPDATCSSILRKEVAPFLKQQNYYSGISAGINAITLATAGEYKAEPVKKKKDHIGNFFPIIGIIIFIIAFIFRRRRGSGGFFYPGGFGSFGGGGGSSGSDFGGFSGGGGDFGGGGSSGSW